MSLVVGIDGGLNGARAIYDTTTPDRVVDLIDIPTLTMTVNNKQRRRIDRQALLNDFEMLKMYGVQLVVLEYAGARPNNSGMFAFGYTIGVIEMAMFYTGLPCETIAPQIWKRMFKVKGKASANKNSDDIIARADDLMPLSRSMWRGPKGGLMVDRAEAAMISKFAGDHMLHMPQQRTEFAKQSRLVYDRIEK